jgi:hypothetical protein
MKGYKEADIARIYSDESKWFEVKDPNHSATDLEEGYSL